MVLSEGEPVPIPADVWTDWLMEDGMLPPDYERQYAFDVYYEEYQTELYGASF